MDFFLFDFECLNRTVINFLVLLIELRFMSFEWLKFHVPFLRIKNNGTLNFIKILSLHFSIYICTASLSFSPNQEPFPFQESWIFHLSITSNNHHEISHHKKISFIHLWKSTLLRMGKIICYWFSIKQKLFLKIF